MGNPQPNDTSASLPYDQLYLPKNPGLKEPPMSRVNVSAIVGWVVISAVSYYLSAWSWWTIASVVIVVLGTVVYIGDRS